MKSALIIGAGVIGSAIAWRLAQAGVQVTLVDQAGIGHGGASARSFGWVNASFAETDTYFTLRNAAITALQQADHDLNLGPDIIQWSGCIWWEDQGDDFTTQHNTLTRRGYDHSLLAPAQFYTASGNHCRWQITPAPWLSPPPSPRP